MGFSSSSHTYLIVLLLLSQCGGGRTQEVFNLTTSSILTGSYWVLGDLSGPGFIYSAGRIANKSPFLRGYTEIHKIQSKAL